MTESPTHRHDAAPADRPTERDRRDDEIRGALEQDQDKADGTIAGERRDARDVQERTDIQRRDARDTQDQAETEQNSDRRDAQDLFDARRQGERREAFEQTVSDHQRADELERVIKNLDAFAYTVSHDLRAPLRAMTGYSELLLEEYGPSLGETGLRSHRSSARITRVLRLIS